MLDIKGPILKWLGGASGIGGGFLVLFSYIDSQMSSLNNNVERMESQLHLYVDLKSDLTTKQLDDVKQMLIKIDNRLYELTKEQK